MRSRSYRAVASRVSAGDALHCSLLTACDVPGLARPQRLINGTAGLRESRNVSQAAKVLIIRDLRPIINYCCTLASVLQAASS